MADEKTGVEDAVPENVPATIATPEGDNEYAPDQPLPDGGEPEITRPRGDEPHSVMPLRPAQD